MRAASTGWAEPTKRWATKPRHRNTTSGGGLFLDTFHGQLARLKVDAKARDLKIGPPAAPTSDEIARFNSSDAVLAAVIARKAGLDISIPRAFLYHLRGYLKSEAEVAMVAHLAEALGDTQTAVRIGKGAIARGLNLVLLRLPDPLDADLHTLAQASRARLPAGDCAPGERIQFAGTVRSRRRVASCRSCR